MPVGAIAGGAAGGVALAVSMVLIWKYWGLVIKRTEKRRHKEAVRSTSHTSPSPHPSFMVFFYS